jgi:hypothetical protein
MTSREELRGLLAASPLSSKDVNSLLLACSDAALRPAVLAVLAKHVLPRASPELVKLLREQLSSWLDGTDVTEHAQAFVALASLFQVDHTLATDLCKSDGFGSRLAEAATLLEVPLSSSSRAEKRTQQLIIARRAFAALLSTSAGYAAMHPTLAELKASTWAEATATRTSEDEESRILATVAAVKLARAAAVDDALLAYLIERTLSSGETQAVAIEGLAVASLRPEAKRTMAANSELLKRLCALAVSRPTADDQASHDIDYSLASVFAHLTAYPAILSEEQQAHEKMRKLALKAQGGSEEGGEPTESNEAVDQRNDIVLRAGAAPALVRLLKSSSTTVRSTASRALLSLCVSQGRRGPILQAGAARALLSWASTSSGKDGTTLDLLAAHALAKLLITANPLLALASSPPLLLDALHVLARLLHHGDANPLQHFESLMALTNIASLAPDLADRLAAIPHLLADLDGYLLEAQPALRRRAATELACNLAGSPAARTRWADTRSATVFLALARMEDEDVPASRAAAGVLARLADVLAPIALAEEKLLKASLELVREDGDDQVAWRGAVFLGEVVARDSKRADEVGIRAALQELARAEGRLGEARAAAKEAVRVYVS